MKSKLLITLICTFFLSNFTIAQSLERKGNRVALQNSQQNIDPNFDRSTGTSGTGANIDVICHRIFWRLNPDSSVGKYIKGSVQFNFKTTQASVTTITFDLRSVLLVDSIRFRTNKFTLNSGYTRSGNIVTLNLGTTLANNFIDSFIVYYQGVPPAISGAAQGFQRTTGTTAGNVLSTLSESYEDRDWWPCKHDMQDKIDSMDITVSVPWGKAGNVTFPLVVDTFWVSTNGKMIDSAIVGNDRIFKFKTKYPIASYLVSVTVARFDRAYWSVNTGTTNVQVVYNLLKGGTSNTAAKTALTNKVNPTLQKWTSLFGEYPFRLEKHGFSAGMDGSSAMEHQTMSSMTAGSVSSVPTLIHEMTHQWFGDNVTFAHWNDLWLAEGFAEYSDALSQEMVPSVGTPATAYTARNLLKNATSAVNGYDGALALSTASTWIPNANSTTSALIWSSNYGSTVYYRGAMVVSMLRAMCGDSIFFSTLTNYQTELAGKVATTDTLRNYFNRALGRDISVFFDDYVGGSDTSSTIKGGIGHPTNNVIWNNPNTNGHFGKRLIISLGTQTKTAGSNVTYFRGPIQIHVLEKSGTVVINDTTITIFDWGGGNLSYAGKGISAPIAGNRLSFELSFVPTDVLYDDSARTLSLGTGTSSSAAGTRTTKTTTLESYTWLGTTNTTWGTATNWLSSSGLTLPPPSGAEILVATSGTNNPILPANTTVGSVTINPGKTLNLNNFALTLNWQARGAGTFIGSPTSSISIDSDGGELNFDQTSAATRSLGSLILQPGAKVNIGAGLLDVYSPLTLPSKACLNVKSAGLTLK